MVDSKWLYLEGSLAEDRIQEFYWLWMFATLGYGVGDVVTTLAVVGHDPSLKEGNVFVHWIFHMWGIPGFVALKLTVFAVCFVISFYAVRAWDDAVLYYLPPLTLTVVGGVITGYNLVLLWP